MSEAISTQTIMQVLRGVMDPELGENIVELGMVRSVEVTSSSTDSPASEHSADLSDEAAGLTVNLNIALTTAACPLRAEIKKEINKRVKSLNNVTDVTITIDTMNDDERKALMAKARWKARESAPETSVALETKVLAIISGKGGVGKSSITMNLAVGLARRGLTVGVLDADIAGFSIPRLAGEQNVKLSADNGKIVPFEKQLLAKCEDTNRYGTLKIVSMGMIEGTAEDEAVMLRGLMLNRALTHFLQDVNWGHMDYLLIDMPPGTSDVQMGLGRLLPRTEMLVVTTPSLAAQKVASRVIDMSRRGYMQVAGVIENMSAFTCEHGQRHALFGEGGGLRLADENKIPLLAQIPLDPTVSSGGSDGLTVFDQGNNHVAQVFEDLAHKIATETSPPITGCKFNLDQLLRTNA